MTPGKTTTSPFELDLLGSVELRRPDGTAVGAVLAQPKRLAVLAYLAIARPQGFHQRDKLLALFWPELDQERARAAMSQAIYTLRRSLGAGAIVTRGATDVAVATGAMLTDVTAFETAIACSDWERAFGLYRGELLEGFHVAGATGFEDWLEGERSRLREAARKAALHLSQRAERADAIADAAMWAKRAFTLAPYDEAELRRLLELLHASHDITGAAQAYQDYARWLRSEMEREPGAETRALLARLMDQQSSNQATSDEAAPRAARTAATVSRPDTPVVTAESAHAVAAPAHAAPTVAAPAIADAPANARRPPRRLLIAAAAVILAIAVFAVANIVRRGGSSPVDPNHIAVLPFAVRGSAEHAYLSHGIVSLLSAGLDGAGAITIVDPQAILSLMDQRGDAALDHEAAKAIALRFGAGSYVLGDIVAAGSSLQITAHVYSGDGRKTLLASAVAPRETDILATVDTLARRILSGRTRSPAERLERVGLLATPSFAAAKAYLEGESHYRHARYEQAFEAYRRAVALDSTFAIAHYRLATVADWVNSTAHIAPSIERALRWAHRADDHEQRLINAHALFWRAGTLDADTAYAALLRTYPDDIDAWYQYGELLFHQGLYVGRPLQAAEAPFRHVIALQPDHQAALAHLMRIAARTGRVALVDSLGRRIDRITSNMERTPEVPLLRAYATRDTVLIAKHIAAINEQPDYPVWVIAWRVAAYAGDMNGALRIIRSDMRSERGEVYRAAAYLSAAHFEAARGRFRAADSLLTQAALLDHEGALRTRGFLAVLPFAPASSARLTALRRQLATDREAQILPQTSMRAHLADPPLPVVLGAMIASRMRDTTTARSLLAQVEGRTQSPVAASYINAIRATIAMAHEGIAPKRETIRSWVLQKQSLHGTPRSAGYTYAYENYMRAELLSSLGRYDEALRWYEAFGNDFGYDVVFFAPAALRRAKILETKGRKAEALRAYDRFLSLWGDADPELQPQVTEARNRRRALGGAASAGAQP